MNFLLSLGIAAAPALLGGQSGVGSLTVHVDRPLHPMAKDFYGLMTEEINHSYDGGLYGELVQNRAFKDRPNEAVAWSTVGGAEMALEDVTVPGTALTRGLRVAAISGGGVANEGFWGVPVRPNTSYRATLWVRADSSEAKPITVALESADGAKTLAKAEIKGAGPTWRKVEVKLRTGAVPASTANRLVVRGVGTFHLASVSLFGPTFKNRPNGNRPDLMALLGGMRPSFLRLPGGNYLEGDTLADWFDWKKTLGPIENRPGHQAPWSYRSSDGMGLLEFLQWCEDLNMKPLLAVYAGYALNGTHIEPGAALEPFVKEALDEIEFVTGAPSTKWGGVRAKLGHPKPFPLEYVEIGNEDWFDRSGSYEGRFAQIYDAIRAKYPKLKLIASANVKSRRPDAIDDHYYRTAAEMARDSDHYRNYDRSGPKIFVGEWASLQGQPTPDFQAALGDAAFLMGLERDSDLVVMEAYAPLLSNMNPGSSQWNTNLIGYDAMRSFGSPSYWVQAMFAQNQGQTVLPVDVETTKPDEAFGYRGRAGVGGSGEGSIYRDVQIAGSTPSSFDAWVKRGRWRMEDGVLRSGGRGDTAVTGSTAMQDTVVTLKAQKATAAGGFTVVFHALDDHNLFRWNVGGGTNELTQTEIFSTRTLKKGEPVTVEPGKWTDLKLEVQGTHVRGYVDGKLALEVDVAAPKVPTVYASASQTGGETIVKVVNLSASAAPLRMNLAGVRGPLSLSGWRMEGELWDQNSLDEPTRIAPRAIPSGTLASGDAYTFPARSITVLRLKRR